MKQVVEFLTLLHENNDKAWFDSHKEMYKRALSCFEEFTAKLIDGIAAFDPSVRGLTVRDCTWRIYRDTRFSPDKTPYKTHMGAFIAPRGKKGGYSGYYFHVEPVWNERSWSHGHQLTTGLYCPLPEVLRSVRDESWTMARKLKQPSVRRKDSSSTSRTNSSVCRKAMPPAVRTTNG